MILGIIIISTLIHKHDDNEQKVRDQTHWHPCSEILVIIVFNRPSECQQNYDKNDSCISS